MQHKETSSTTAFLVPLPNKREKLELILQKLTEIGVDEIILRPAERSQLKTIPEQKRSRWQTIITEAAEQSWRWSIPEVRYIKDCTALDNQSGTKSSTKYVYKVFDISRTDSEKETSQKNILEAFPADSISKVTCGLIGPEGGLSERDYAAFPLPYEVISLGETVLRMETAAIIGGRKIVAERK